MIGLISHNIDVCWNYLMKYRYDICIKKNIGGFLFFQDTECVILIQSIVSLYHRSPNPMLKTGFSGSF